MSSAGYRTVYYSCDSRSRLSGYAALLVPFRCRGTRPGWGAWIAAALLTMASFAVRADVSLQWQGAAGSDKAAAAAAAKLAESRILSDFVALVDQNFGFDPPLVLAIGSTAGPHYDREGRMLRLPYAYLIELVRAYGDIEDDRTKALAAALDATEYTLYFLLGQALADRTDVENDQQAEALATWSMVAHWPNGGEQWLDAIAAFGRLSQFTDGSLEQFWHRHSLYRSRERELRCLAFGSNPDLLTSRMPAVVDEAERLRHCTTAWRRLVDDSRVAVEALLLPNAPLAIQD